MIQPTVQSFTAGMNGDESPFVIDLSHCSQVQNMLFERGLLISRPGAPAVFSSIGGGVCPTFARSFPFVAGDVSPRHALLLARDDKFSLNLSLYLLSTRESGSSVLFDETAITAAVPGTLTWDNNSPFDAVVVNGAWLITGATEGLIHYVPGDATYTLLAPNARYVTAHISRALAAFTSGTNGHITILWSKMGDETVWSGDPSAGSAVLADVDDCLSGLATVRGMVVVAREFGFHVGVPTGTSLPPYDWKKVGKEAAGVFFPRSMAVHGDLLYFASENGVHTFDLVNVEDIGEGILTELFEIIRTKHCTLDGFVTTTYKSGRRPQYHLVPTANPDVIQDPFPVIPPQVHFVYDIISKTWSRHVYDSFAGDLLPPIACGLKYCLTEGDSALNDVPRQGPTLIRRNIDPGGSHPVAGLTNGNFATDTVWVKGTGWTISGGAAHSSSLTAYTDIHQSAGLTLGVGYVVTFTVSNYVSGEIHVLLGGTSYGTARSANGTFTETIVGGATAVFYLQTGAAGFVGDIDDVILVPTGVFSYHLWRKDTTPNCDSIQSFTTGRIQLGDPTQEYELERVLVVVNSSAATTLVFNITSMLGGTDSSEAFNLTIPQGWSRQWLDARKAGQFFQVRMTAPAGLYLEFRELILLAAEQGETRP